MGTELQEVWYLIGAALVFFMQAGFAMVESGFTRAKNTGNIVMKNLMDFCLGTVVFILIGAPLLLATEAVAGGLFGNPVGVWGNLFANRDYDWSGFVFNLVFCATTATIVSGSMAERTNFKAYCIYSLIISAIIYPVEAFWVWGYNNSSWLQQMAMAMGNAMGVQGTTTTFLDFAGSAAIHSVGGTCALIGAIILGPRLGKYTKSEDGTIKVNAIPGHNILIGSLGVFILWFGWYGFNGAACTTLSGIGSLGHVFMTTTVAAAIATVATMMYTWIKNGKPDVSMTLNGSLAGLVGVTAGCAYIDIFGAIAIGLVSGILVVVVVEKLDLKLHIDDPVGAVGVHFANGIWGTLACGLFSIKTGLFYTGNGTQLLVQIIGLSAILAWTIPCAIIMFTVMKKIKRADGSSWLRATAEEELKGLDQTEHGLVSAYADFTINNNTLFDGTQEKMGDIPVTKAITIDNRETKNSSSILTKVEIVCRQRMLEPLKEALGKLGITGMTVTNVLGCGMQKGQTEYYRGVPVEVNLLPKIQIDLVISKISVEAVIETTRKALYTGHIGDGKIFIYDVLNVVKVRTGEEGYDALKD